jgi:hypothetical protein
MAAGADDKTAKANPQHRQAPILPDQGRGDMVSENRAANERFERNSQALQQQARSDQAHTQPVAGTSQAQDGKTGLIFAPDRQHGQNYGQLKQEQANAIIKDEGQQHGAKTQEQGAKKELSFGADRQPNRQNHGQLKQEQAEVAGRGQGQQQGEKKGLSFGPGREHGQGQDHGHGR